MLGVSMRLGGVLAMITVASCGTPTSGLNSANGVELPRTGFTALIDKFLPGTTDHDWNQLLESDGQPLPATDMVFASSLDQKVYVAFFNFRSVTDAASFYAKPPGAIKQFVEIALGYAPLTGATGVATPSYALDFRSCTGEGTGPSLLPSGQCSDGTASFSIGVGTILQRGSVDVFLGYVGTKRDHADPSDLAKLTPYANGCLQLLESVRLPS